MVGVYAYIGGNRCATDAKPKYFLIPEAEYDSRGRFSFIIDPARHQEVPEFPSDRYEKTPEERAADTAALSLSAA